MCDFLCRCMRCGYIQFRINRILELPRGSALLVGVGGSGKQSLARLAAFISGLEVTQIQLKKGYGVGDLKNELSGLYLKAGLKNVGIMFLMTDAQIPNEQFLVMINDMLASGEIPDLFPDDEIENIIAGVRNEVKGKNNIRFIDGFHANNRILFLCHFILSNK